MKGVIKGEATGPVLFINPWVIACSFGVTAYYYYTSFRTTQRFSDKYRNLLQDRTPSSYSGLHQSWLSPILHERPMDLKDPQWHACRDAFPTLAAAAVAFLFASNLLQFALTFTDSSPFQVVVRRSWFYLVYGFIFMYMLHDASVVKPLVFIALNYLLVIGLKGGKVAPYVTWCFTIMSLMLVNAGYCDRISWVLRDPSWLVSVDVKIGLYPWTTCFNLMILRLQSFNMDYWWALQREKRAVAPMAANSLSVGKREVHHPSHYYEVFTVYVGYVCYAPLYIAGPVITFENFLAHQLSHPDNQEWKRKSLYALRLVGAILLLEVLNHYAYVGAITHMAFRHRLNEEEGVAISLLEYVAQFDNSFEVDVGGIVHYSHWMLIFLWLKFLIIWRFFRLWAMLDNIYPPENMKKCVNSNYSVTGFWRGWHCSFNEWLIKYVYIPLGGSRVTWTRQLLNFFLVFTFVALWHDIEAKLLVWSGALTLFSIPHILGSRIMQTSGYKRFAASNENAMVLLAACSGSANILMLKTANVIGFALGVEGVTMVHSKAKLSTFLPFLCVHFLFMTANALFSQTIEYWRNLPGEIKRKN